MHKMIKICATILALITTNAMATHTASCPSGAYVWRNVTVIDTPAGKQQRVITKTDKAYVGTKAIYNKTLQDLYDFRQKCQKLYGACYCTVKTADVVPSGNTCQYKNFSIHVEQRAALLCDELFTLPCSERAGKSCAFNLLEISNPKPLDPSMKPIEPQPSPIALIINTPKFTNHGDTVNLGSQPFFIKNDCAGGGSGEYCIDSDYYDTPFQTSADDNTAWGGNGNIEYDRCTPADGTGKCRPVDPAATVTLNKTAEFLDSHQFLITYDYQGQTAFRIKTSKTFDCDIAKNGNSRQFELDSKGNIVCFPSKPARQ